MVAVKTFSFLFVLFDDSFSQNKLYNAHDVTLRAVLEIMLCSCTHILRQQRLRTQRLSRTIQYVCSKQKHVSAPFIHTQNMQDSYLNGICAA